MSKSYREKLASDTAAAAAQSTDARDIAGGWDALPPVNAARRKRCGRDLKKFCRTYFPEAFPLPFSADHEAALKSIQTVIVDGGLQALAMPRGTGKTTITVRAAMWAALYGYRRFVVILSATQGMAAGLLQAIKTELEWNDRLGEDFPDVCYPIRRLENNARRCVGQLFRGQQTLIKWKSDFLAFPLMPDDACHGANVSEAVIAAAGLTGAIRGKSHSRSTGQTSRPDLVILDDPQTRDSATNPLQSAKRAAIIQGDVLGMAGPGKKKIAAIMPCTVIVRDDLADQMLDMERNPQWGGYRTKAVYAWPTASDLWDKYHKLRAAGMQAKKGWEDATAFYRGNRPAMDAGAEVAWADRFDTGEVSAVQHVENLRSDIGEEAFEAEFNNNPSRADEAEGAALTAGMVSSKVRNIGRGVVPHAATILTMSVDVHDALLFWSVAAWCADFTGHVIAYGVYPEQRKGVFTLRKASPTLTSVCPGAGREGAIRAGLDALAGAYLGRDWMREDGSAMRVERCLVDSGYVPTVVFDFCRESQFSTVLMPSRGVGIGAAKTPMAEWPVKAGERRGWFWNTGKIAHRTLRHVRFDANHWKSFLHARFAAALGDRGGLTLFGSRADEHRLIGEHVTAESPVMVAANGRTVAEWRMRPGFTDNHWFDTLVGCAVAASMGGAVFSAGVGGAGAGGRGGKRKTTSYAEMQRRAQNGGR